MRIISGKHRGRKLSDFGGENIRPTTDRVKECLFNILAGRIAGATALDLFCGSGALGIECISRGAELVCFNDISRDSIAVLKKNLAAIGEQPRCEVTNLDYSVYLARCNKKFDLIFLDPPYRFDYGVPALQTVADRGLLKSDGVAVYERDRAFCGECGGLELFDERKYGKTYLSFFKLKEE